MRVRKIEKEWKKYLKGEVMCESNLSYLMACPRFLVLFHLSLSQPGFMSFFTATNPDYGPSDKEWHPGV